MPAIGLPTTVNPHLRRVLAAAGARLRVGSAVRDAQGRLLLEAGAPLSADALATLAGAGPLQAPLESVLILDDALDAAQLAAQAAHQIDTSPALAHILAACGGIAPELLTFLRELRLSAPIAALLTIGPSHEHCVLVSLLAGGFARALGLSEDDQRSAVAAGLLHDLGELYVHPAALTGGRALQAQEWSQAVSHPRIGQMLVNELDHFPLAVGRAVAEHHERFNGTGYPRQLDGGAISGPGRAVGVAEMIAGLLVKDQPLARAELALKIVPGEHPPALVSVLSAALRAAGAEDAGDGGDGLDVERLYWRIASAQQATQTLLAGAADRDPRANAMLERTLERIGTIQRAFHSTGLDAWLRPGHGLADARHYLFEKDVATREIAWRLRDIARDLALHTKAGERNIFAALIKLLDADGQAAAKDEPAAAHPASFAASRPTIQ